MGDNHDLLDAEVYRKFEVIYGTAFAPDEGQPVKTAEGDVATFSVKALRSKSRNRP